MQIETLAIDRVSPTRATGFTELRRAGGADRRQHQGFGFTNPVLIDADGGIIADPGRVMGARCFGLAVKCRASGSAKDLTDAQAARVRHRRQPAGAQRRVGRRNARARNARPDGRRLRRRPDRLRLSDAKLTPWPGWTPRIMATAADEKKAEAIVESSGDVWVMGNAGSCGESDGNGPTVAKRCWGKIDVPHQNTRRDIEYEAGETRRKDRRRRSHATIPRGASARP